MNKTELHRLVDELHESQIPSAGSYLSYIVEKQPGADPHDSAPYDDEEYPEDLLESLDEAHEEYKRGETFSQDEIERRYGVA
jgi:hypothetical protein